MTVGYFACANVFKARFQQQTSKELAAKCNYCLVIDLNDLYCLIISTFFSKTKTGETSAKTRN